MLLHIVCQRSLVFASLFFYFMNLFVFTPHLSLSLSFLLPELGRFLRCTEQLQARGSTAV